MVTNQSPLYKNGKAVNLSLPFPPSANRLWRAVNGRNIKSEEYREWLDEARCAVLLQPRSVRANIPGHYQMTMTADRPDKRRRDLSNLLKPTEDLLQQAGIVADDCNAQQITIAWSDRPAGKGAQVHVKITPWGEA